MVIELKDPMVYNYIFISNKIVVFIYFYNFLGMVYISIKN